MLCVFDDINMNKTLFLFVQMCTSLACIGCSPQVTSPTRNKPKYTVMKRAAYRLDK